MSITLDELTLPDGLSWPDRHAWSPVKQTAEHSDTGQVIVQYGTVTGGRPIVLTGPVWLTETELLAILAKRDAGADLTLDFHGTQYPVRFDYDAGAVESAPVFDTADAPDGADMHELTAIRFISLS